MCMGKKTITLSETELVNLINKVVKKNSGISEQSSRFGAIQQSFKERTPGLDIKKTTQSVKQSKPTLKNGMYNNVKVTNTNNGVLLNINGVNYKVCS
jgi:hypothetical protein